MSSIAIIGAGAWGTVVANILAENGHQVLLWCYKDHIADGIEHRRQHHRLPGVFLSERIQVTTHMSDCYAHDLVILGLASTQLKQYEQTVDWALITCPVVFLAKGIIEPDWFISDWLNHHVSTSIAVLSGPNLALEIGLKKPAASVLASKDNQLALFVQQLLSNAYFRVYTSQDIRGVECGGIFKNVFAIAAGCIDGLQLGDNAKSALITRGLIELERLFEFFGAEKETLLGLSGLGDLIATSSSQKSRNWQLGYDVVTNPNRSQWELSNRGQTEGVRTIKLMQKMFVEESLNLPIMMSVGRLFDDNSVSPQQIIQELMERGLKSEFDH